MRKTRLNLVRLLPDYAVTGVDVSLVSPPTAYEPTRVALLRDFLTERLRPLMQKCTLAVQEQKASRQLAEKRGADQRRNRAAL